MEYSYSSPNKLRWHTFENIKVLMSKSIFPVIEVTANILSCLLILLFVTGLPRWNSGTESAWQCRRCKRWGFDPWVGKIPRRRKWQPTTLLWLEIFHGQRSLAGYSLWDHKESDMTERISMHTFCKYTYSMKNLSPKRWANWVDIIAPMCGRSEPGLWGLSSAPQHCNGTTSSFTWNKDFLLQLCLD